MDLAGLSDMDGFEPQTRARSNTWPLPRPDNYVEGGGMGGGGGGGVGGGMDGIGGGGGGGHCGGGMGAQCLPEGLQGAGALGAAGAKKNSSRRNAWGNLSYADLITQAITTAPEKRLTLSQIYEYMVHNVPYFKDKGDSNSSAGWKNSIRHNLSLHNRFMRVQNEGTGKSSWWMINPDAKPGKSARRRATSMETSKFEKRRGRVKKKVEALRNGLTLDHTPSPSSSVSEGLDLFPDSPLHATAGFQLSPDFRPRASSNASSCGRLSPIPAVLGETDWSSPGFPTQYGPEQLSANLAEGMKLHQDPAYCMSYPPPPPYASSYEASAASYRLQQQQQQQQQHGASPYGLASPPQCPLHRLQPCSCGLQPAGMSPSYPQSEPSPDPQFAAPARVIRRNNTGAAQTPETRTPSTMMGQLMGALNNSTLLDDLNLNIETLHGGFDCNVEEVIKHELSMDGSLDFNYPALAAHQNHHNHHHNHHHHHPGHHHQAMSTPDSQLTAPPQTTVAPYTSSVTSSGHWVH